jgi:hypothetical protein
MEGDRLPRELIIAGFFNRLLKIDILETLYVDVVQRKGECDR